MLALVSAPGCTRREPPTPDGSPSVAPPDLSGGSAEPPPRTPVSEDAASFAVAPSVLGARAGPSATLDPARLPQTHDMPSSSGPSFDAMSAALWEGIVRDKPAIAMASFFPRAAYAQVKAVSDPGADWQHRLVSAFERDIHALHTQLGGGADRARLVGLEVPQSRARWVEPGEEWNKLGYFRVFGSALRYEIDGSKRAFEVKSLISWRGQWYVVHLCAIK
jgi:hypothetical protein